MRIQSVVAGVFVAAFATMATTAFGQDRGKLKWALKVSETRGPVRAADVSTPLGREVRSEILGGPANGSDMAYLIFTRMPGGARGPALFTLPDEHIYVVLEGKLNVQIGTDKFVAEKDTAVVIPPGIPHEASNADATSETRVYEIIAPGSSLDLMSMLKAAQPRKVENAAQYIRTAPPLPPTLKSGLNSQLLTDRSKGSTVQLRIDNTNPAQGGPRPHVHKFEQVYFSIEGMTTMTHGLLTYPLPKYSVGITNAGAIHTNSNQSGAMERHITLISPQPPTPNSKTEPWDIEIEFKGGV